MENSNVLSFFSTKALLMSKASQNNFHVKSYSDDKTFVSTSLYVKRANFSLNNIFSNKVTSVYFVTMSSCDRALNCLLVDEGCNVHKSCSQKEKDWKEGMFRPQTAK